MQYEKKIRKIIINILSKVRLDLSLPLEINKGHSPVERLFHGLLRPI